MPVTRQQTFSGDKHVEAGPVSVSPTFWGQTLQFDRKSDAPTPKDKLPLVNESCASTKKK